MQLPKYNPPWAEPLGMLLLRVGCAWFIFVWAVNKFFAPGQYQFILKRFDKIEAELWTVYGIAIAQTVICVLVFIGLWRGISRHDLPGLAKANRSVRDFREGLSGEPEFRHRFGHIPGHGRAVAAAGSGQMVGGRMVAAS